MGDYPWAGHGAWDGDGGPWDSTGPWAKTFGTIGGPLGDYLAVVSVGAFPTPTPTGAQRAAYAVSWGLIKDFV